jgi:hypothetical protein
METLGACTPVGNESAPTAVAILDSAWLMSVP